MAFVCPQCSPLRSLEIVRSIELPADSRSDEITLQVVRCTRCGLAAAAVYEESRRGALGEESVDHAGYRVSRGYLRQLQSMIGHCPRPRDRRCGCDVHRILGRRDEAGRWALRGELARKGSFPLSLG